MTILITSSRCRGVRRQSVIGGLEHVLLVSILRLGDSPAYGLSIREEAERLSGKSILLPVIYKTLARMENEGYVSSRIGKPEHVRGGRAKVLYQIKPNGWRAIYEAHATHERMWDGIDVARLSQRFKTPSLKLRESTRSPQSSRQVDTEKDSRRHP